MPPTMFPLLGARLLTRFRRPVRAYYPHTLSPQRGRRRLSLFAGRKFLRTLSPIPLIQPPPVVAGASMYLRLCVRLPGGWHFVFVEFRRVLLMFR